MVSNSDKMTLNSFVNYVMFDNPLCKKLSSYVTVSILPGLHPNIVNLY